MGRSAGLRSRLKELEVAVIVKETSELSVMVFPLLLNLEASVSYLSLLS